MTNTLEKELLTFSQATKKLPKINGHSLHPATLWRWARKGVGGVQLETLRLGRRFYVTAEQLESFGRRLAEADKTMRAATVQPSPRRPRTEAQRTKDLARAEAECREAGI